MIKMFILFFCLNSCFIEKKGYFCGEIVRELQIFCNLRRVCSVSAW